MSATREELEYALNRLRLEAQHFLIVNRPLQFSSWKGEKFLKDAIDSAIKILEKK